MKKRKPKPILPKRAPQVVTEWGEIDGWRYPLAVRNRVVRTKRKTAKQGEGCEAIVKHSEQQ